MGEIPPSKQAPFLPCALRARTFGGTCSHLVLSKATVPFVILPLLTVVLAVMAHAVMLLLSSAVLMANGQGVGTLWAHVSLPRCR
jgi:hypothetical protein